MTKEKKKSGEDVQPVDPKGKAKGKPKKAKTVRDILGPKIGPSRTALVEPKKK